MGIVKIKISRRGAAIGVLFGIAAILSGIVVINYTEAFYLVVILWIVAPVIIVQLFRRVRRMFARG